MEFELTYFEIAVQQVSHYTSGSPPYFIYHVINVIFIHLFNIIFDFWSFQAFSFKVEYHIEKGTTSCFHKRHIEELLGCFYIFDFKLNWICVFFISL